MSGKMNIVNTVFILFLRFSCLRISILFSLLIIADVADAKTNITKIMQFIIIYNKGFAFIYVDR